MKELYISPEAELIGFVAKERLATNVGFDGMDNTGNFETGSAESVVGDIRLPFPSL